MPTVKRYPSFVIRMYFEDHNPPHVHIVGPEFEAKMTIANARLIKGSLPSDIESQAAAWIAENRKFLMSMWEEFK